MDLYDKKILKLLISNSRYSFKDIAQSVNLSKDSVKYRIERMRKERVFESYSLMIDMRTLGYTVYQLLISLHDLDISEELSYLVKHKNVTFVSSQTGFFDLQVIFHAKSSYDSLTIREDILSVLSSKIKNFQIFFSVVDYDFSFFFEEIDVPVEIKKRNDGSFSTLLSTIGRPHCSREQIAEIDRVDKEILRSLVKDSRESLFNIGKQVGLSSVSVKKRIQKLIEKKVIFQFSLYPRYEYFNLLTFMNLLKIKPLSKEKNKAFEAFMTQNPNIIYANKIQGNFSHLVYFLAKSPQEYKKNSSKIKQLLGEDLVSSDLSILTQVHCFKMICDEFFEE